MLALVNRQLLAQGHILQNHGLMASAEPTNEPE
jgi:hypothetical protein